MKGRVPLTALRDGGDDLLELVLVEGPQCLGSHVAGRAQAEQERSRGL